MHYLALLLLSCFLSASAKAQDNAPEIKYDAFGVPEQEVRVIKAAPAPAAAAVSSFFPDCADVALQNGVRQLLSQDESRISDASIAARRARLLALKNIGGFTPVEVSSFKPDDNYELANILITAKVNEGLTNADFRICAGDNPVLKRRVFLLLQRTDDGVKVYVANYRSGTVPSFFYEK